MRLISNENINIYENFSNEKSENSKKHNFRKIIQTVKLFGVILRILKKFVEKEFYQLSLFTKLHIVN